MQNFIKIVFFFYAFTNCSQEHAYHHPSPLQSGSNGVRCDVDYSRLNTNRLSGISIHDQGIDASEKIRHLNELNSMPESFLRIMRNKISVNLTKGGITEFAALSHLKGVVPRGWESTGFTWDSVPGGGTPGALYLGNSYLPNGTYSIAIHEATHSVDFANSIKYSSDFLEAYNAEKNSPHSSDPVPAYRLNYPEEYLAIAVDEYFCSSATRDNLYRMYPKAYRYVASHF